MRFLLGLIAGAIVTILLADTTDGLTPAVGNDLQRVWSNLIDETTELVLGLEPAANDAETGIPADAPAKTTAEKPAKTTAEKPAKTTAESNAETTTIAAQPQQDPSPGLFQQPVATESTPSPPEATIPIDRFATETEPLLPTDDAILATSPTPTGTATIWEPFHSEISARGFAKRLSLQLGYPFAVSKQGPARYLVVFDYQTDAERSLLEQQIAALTGYRHP